MHAAKCIWPDLPGHRNNNVQLYKYSETFQNNECIGDATGKQCGNLNIIKTTSPMYTSLR